MCAKGMVENPTKNTEPVVQVSWLVIAGNGYGGSGPA